VLAVGACRLGGGSSSEDPFEDEHDECLPRPSSKETSSRPTAVERCLWSVRATERRRAILSQTQAAMMERRATCAGRTEGLGARRLSMRRLSMRALCRMEASACEPSAAAAPLSLAKPSSPHLGFISATPRLHLPRQLEQRQCKRDEGEDADGGVEDVAALPPEGGALAHNP